jgi:hypothetical protein
MKWKKDNNYKSLNDPHVKLEANATNSLSINDTSWSSINHSYTINGNKK